MSEESLLSPEEIQKHISPDKSWQEIVAWVGDLPPLPHVAAKALSLVEDPNVTAGKLTDLLGQDTALAARVLKIANSAMFSRQREITTINQAIMIIGFKALKGIIVAATLRQLNRSYGGIEKAVWENSTCTAAACHILAQKLRKPFVDEAYLLGLLHDLGKLVLIRQTPEEYKLLFEAESEQPYHEREQQALGFAHPLIGALVAKKWNFSHESCQVILHHHNPVSMPTASELDEKTLIVQVADLIAHKLGKGHFDGYPDQEAPARAGLAGFGIEDPEEQEKLFEDIEVSFAEQSAVFGN